eukprot:g1996.t1
MECMPCPPGYVCEGGRASRRKLCAEPTQHHAWHMNATDETCQPCPRGRLCDGSVSEPQPCAAGSSCEAGVSQPCSPGHTSLAGQSQCCPAGKLQDGDTGGCNPCPAGHACDGATKTECAWPQYPATPATQCNTCPPGHTCNAGGSSTQQPSRRLAASGTTCLPLAFQAEKSSSQAASKHWTEVTGWRTSGDPVLFDASHGAWDNGNGRFTATSAGYYRVSANIRLDSLDPGYARVLIAKNGDKDIHNGLNSIEGNKLSSDYDTITVDGLVKLAEGDHVSVFVYSSNDNSFHVERGSGFSVNFLGSNTISVQADKSGMQAASTGWTEVTSWRTSGTATLYDASGGAWDNANGRFTASTAGYYRVSTNIRADSLAASSYARVLIAKNGDKDYQNGLHSIRGSGKSTDYTHLRVSGLVQLGAGDYVSVYVYSRADTSWTVYDQSGFSINFVGANPTAMQSDKNGQQTVSKGWTEVAGWRTSGDPVLFDASGGAWNNANGRFTATAIAGYYRVSANIRGDQHDSASYARVLIAKNGDKDQNNGLMSIKGNSKSTNYMQLQTSGLVYLDVGDYVSVYVYSNGDASWVVYGESGFSVSLLSNCPVTLPPECQPRAVQAEKSSSQAASKHWTEVTGWRTSGDPVLFDASHGAWDNGNGRFTATSAGYYRVSANIRLDSLDPGYARVLIAKNGDKDIHNGLNSIEGNKLSSDYDTITVDGLVKLAEGDHVSVFVYSSNDNSFHVERGSGFSVNFLGSNTISVQADKSGMQAASTGWTEVTSWRTSGTATLYDASGGAWDNANGRFTASTAGYYRVSTNIRADSLAASSYARVLIAKNGDKDYQNGLHSIRGSGKSTDYTHLRVSGLVQLGAGDYVSVYVYSRADTSWTVYDQSGFSINFVGANPTAMQSDKNGQQTVSKGWTEVAGWRTSGDPVLFDASGGAWNNANGRFTATAIAGYYRVSANIRGDQHDSASYARVLIAKNGDKDQNNGLMSIKGNSKSTNYMQLQTSGLVYLDVGDYVSVYVYSNGDASWVVYGESGFSVSLLSACSTTALPEHASGGSHTLCPADTVAFNNKCLGCPGGATCTGGVATCPFPTAASHDAAGSVSGHVKQHAASGTDDRDYYQGTYALGARKLAVAAVKLGAQQSSYPAQNCVDGDLGTRCESKSSVAAEDALKVSPDGIWTCRKLLDWQGAKVCTTSTGWTDAALHHGWAQKCPATCEMFAEGVSDSSVSIGQSLRLDLGAAQQVASLKIYNRRDCCQGDFNNFVAELSDSGGASADEWTTCAEDTLPASSDDPYRVACVGRGRYVRLRMVGSTKHLSLQEVMVYGFPMLTVATAQLSSTHSGHPPQHCIDGKLDTMCQSGSGSSGQWLSLDLGAAQQVASLKIYNRRDCCQDRFGKFVAELSDSGGASAGEWTTCAEDTLPASSDPHDVACVGHGQYVRLRMVGVRNSNTGWLNLQEVEVYGASSLAQWEPGITTSTVPAVRVGLVNKDDHNEWIVYQNGRWEMGDDATAWRSLAGRDCDGPPIAYVHAARALTRVEARAVCQGAEYRRLCDRREVAGFSNGTKPGVMRDFVGSYSQGSMTAADGGAQGAYCCDRVPPGECAPDALIKAEGPPLNSESSAAGTPAGNEAGVRYTNVPPAAAWDWTPRDVVNSDVQLSWDEGTWYRLSLGKDGDANLQGNKFGDTNVDPVPPHGTPALWGHISTHSYLFGPANGLIRWSMYLKSGWTHTRNYHKGYRRDFAGQAVAEINGLHKGRQYDYRLYQYCTHPRGTSRPIKVNGKPAGTSKCSANEDSPSLRGRATATCSGAGCVGKITFEFEQVSGHVALSGIAMLESGALRPAVTQGSLQTMLDACPAGTEPSGTAWSRKQIYDETTGQPGGYENVTHAFQISRHDSGVQFDSKFSLPSPGALACADEDGWPVMKVLSASYGHGEGCHGKENNALEDMARVCDGKETCAYGGKSARAKLGDVHPGCGKAFAYSYTCNGEERTGDQEPEASQKDDFTLACNSHCAARLNSWHLRLEACRPPSRQSLALLPGLRARAQAMTSHDVYMQHVGLVGNSDTLSCKPCPEGHACDGTKAEECGWHEAYNHSGTLALQTSLDLTSGWSQGPPVRLLEFGVYYADQASTLPPSGSIPRYGELPGLQAGGSTPFTMTWDMKLDTVSGDKTHVATVVGLAPTKSTPGGGKGYNTGFFRGFEWLDSGKNPNCRTLKTWYTYTLTAGLSTLEIECGGTVIHRVPRPDDVPVGGYALYFGRHLGSDAAATAYDRATGQYKNLVAQYNRVPPLWRGMQLKYTFDMTVSHATGALLGALGAPDALVSAGDPRLAVPTTLLPFTEWRESACGEYDEPHSYAVTVQHRGIEVSCDGIDIWSANLASGAASSTFMDMQETTGCEGRGLPCQPGLSSGPRVATLNLGAPSAGRGDHPACNTTGYKNIASGTCTSHGLEYITSAEECKAAAQAVGADVLDGLPGPSGNRQRNCGTQGGHQWLHFNTQTSGYIDGHPILNEATAASWQICRDRASDVKWGHNFMQIGRWRFADVRGELRVAYTGDTYWPDKPATTLSRNVEAVVTDSTVKMLHSTKNSEYKTRHLHTPLPVNEYGQGGNTPYAKAPNPCCQAPVRAQELERPIDSTAPGIAFGDRFVQIGTWRICALDDGRGSICTTTGETAELALEDGRLIDNAHDLRGSETCCHDREIDNYHPDAPTIGDGYIEIGQWRLGAAADHGSCSDNEQYWTTRNVARNAVGLTWAAACLKGGAGAYLQQDLGRVRSVSAIETGVRGGGSKERVTAYSVSYSVNGVHYHNVSCVAGDSTLEGWCKGNSATGGEEVVKRFLNTTVQARFVRLYVRSFNEQPSLRMGVMACGATVPDGEGETWEGSNRVGANHVWKGSNAASCMAQVKRQCNAFGVNPQKPPSAGTTYAPMCNDGKYAQASEAWWACFYYVMGGDCHKVDHESVGLLQELRQCGMTDGTMEDYARADRDLNYQPQINWHQIAGLSEGNGACHGKDGGIRTMIDTGKAAMAKAGKHIVSLVACGPAAFDPIGLAMDVHELETTNGMGHGRRLGESITADAPAWLSTVRNVGKTSGKGETLHGVELYASLTNRKLNSKRVKKIMGAACEAGIKEALEDNPCDIGWEREAGKGACAKRLFRASNGAKIACTVLADWALLSYEARRTSFDQEDIDLLEAADDAKKNADGTSARAKDKAAAAKRAKATADESWRKAKGVQARASQDKANADRARVAAAEAEADATRQARQAQDAADTARTDADAALRAKADAKDAQSRASQASTDAEKARVEASGALTDKTERYQLAMNDVNTAVLAHHNAKLAEDAAAGTATAGAARTARIAAANQLELERGLLNQADRDLNVASEADKKARETAARATSEANARAAEAADAAVKANEAEARANKADQVRTDADDKLATAQRAKTAADKAQATASQAKRSADSGASAAASRKRSASRTAYWAGIEVEDALSVQQAAETERSNLQTQREASGQLEKANQDKEAALLAKEKAIIELEGADNPAAKADARSKLTKAITQVEVTTSAATAATKNARRKLPAWKRTHAAFTAVAGEATGAAKGLVAGIVAEEILGELGLGDLGKGCDGIDLSDSNCWAAAGGWAMNEILAQVNADIMARVSTALKPAAKAATSGITKGVVSAWKAGKLGLTGGSAGRGQLLAAMSTRLANAMNTVRSVSLSKAKSFATKKLALAAVRAKRVATGVAKKGLSTSAGTTG